jgi:hypothetical protein
MLHATSGGVVMRAFLQSASPNPRAGPVKEDQEARPFTTEELQRHLEKGRAHIVFDDPPPPV